MNKNDKFLGMTPPNRENNISELSDDELDRVSGGIMKEDLKAF